jgi:hypothetical protein
MGLTPMGAHSWIETDTSIATYHAHKLQQRDRRGANVYRASEASLPAQRELHAALLRHLAEDQPDNYRIVEDQLECVPGRFDVPLAGNEPLWDCSLWIADDLVLMERIEGSYRLTAASLCSPSHWRLQEKFNQPMRTIHDPIPGFHEELSPKIDRFFDHLRPEHPVVRFNWAIQADDALAQLPENEPAVSADTPLFYRAERQSLLRLPTTGAIAFTIRVYLHPLEALRDRDGAMDALLAAVDAAPEPLKHYKGFDRLEPALARYRDCPP